MTFHYPSGHIYSCYAQDNRVRPYTYKTVEEAVKAYDKAVAVEKIKRRIIELQGDWKPNWEDFNESKYFIILDNEYNQFIYIYAQVSSYPILMPYIKTQDIAQTIINEMEKELKVIFDIKKDC